MMPTLQNHQSSLAKLLARENLTIQHGNFSTAFFDVKNRVLGLPNWKDRGKDVYDLLVGHEVGHALYTPSWDPSSFPCPPVYVNVVEDVRIERMIQETYPGLIACFRRGYTILFRENFFGTKDKDFAKYNLADRLNLKAKLGSLIELPFHPQEKHIVDQVYSAKTWEEVLAASKALYDFCKEEANKPEEKNKKKDSPSEQSETQQSETQQSETQQSDETSRPEEGPNKSSNEGEETPTGSKEIEPEVETAESFEQESKNLIDTSRSAISTAVVRESSRKDWEDRIVRFEDVFRYRDDCDSYRRIAKDVFSQKSFDSFYEGSKKYVAVLVKEFELRKAAYQYSRATTSRSGVLDVNKLHSYKTSDDIFLSITNLATAKSHGMIMVIDFSGSMSSILGNILQHTIQLSMFCRRVGIPFEVYSFTDGSIPGKPYTAGENSDSKVDLGHLVMNELVSSKMSKPQFHRAIWDLYQLGVHGNYCFPGNEQLRGTPLIEATIVTHYLVKDFLARNRVQKMTTMFLTDGDGHSIRLLNNSEYAKKRTQDQFGCVRYSFDILGHKFTSPYHSKEMGHLMMESLRKSTGSKVLGFYIPSSDKNAMSRVLQAVNSVPTKIVPIDKRPTWDENLKHGYKRDYSVCIDHAHGYDKYFVVAPGQDLGIEDKTFDFEGKDRKALTKAFTNHSTSRKNSRVFLTKFAEAIA